MNKLLCIILTFVLVFSLVACSNSSADTVADNTTALSAEESTKKTDGKNVLVVYFSATGSTKSVAETISDYLGADIFEITPVKPYTSDDLDWTDENSRVSVEHNDESKRVVPLTKTTPDNWEQYDTVYIGYPIWWGIAAWPVNGFIEANDFSGKTVIPFCTSASSDIGSSSDPLKEAANFGNWSDGKRFSSSAAEEDVREWLQSNK